MKHRLLYNQRSRLLVVRRENAALREEAYTFIQPEESPPWWSVQRMQLQEASAVVFTF